jgi:hypothetical protein
MRALPSFHHILPFALVAALTVVAACDDDDDPTGPGDEAAFDATLTGASERPDPVTTDASGSASVEADGETVSFEVEVEDIDEVTMAHIHVGGTEVAGPIVVTLFESPDDPQSFTDRETLAEGTFTEDDITPAGGITTLDDLLAQMEAGNTYVNVHTTANPTGEIRGQLDER